MSYFEFLSCADAALLPDSLLVVIKYSGLAGLLTLLMGAVGALLVGASFRGVKVRPWRAFLTLAAFALILGWGGSYWGYLGVLPYFSPEWPFPAPTSAEIAGGASQALCSGLLGTATASALAVTAFGMAWTRRRWRPRLRRDLRVYTCGPARSSETLTGGSAHRVHT